MLRHLATALSLTAAIVGCGAPPADLLLVNARVYTLDWGDPAPDGTPAPDALHGPNGWRPDAEAVGIIGGRIVFVGGDEDAEALRGPQTVVRDLRGATVLPGLVDSHTHVAGLGANLSRVDLRGTRTEEEVIVRLEEARGDTPPGEWIVGYGWDEGAWANGYPDMRLLSRRFPDNPVVLRSLHGFATWGNRRAFEEAGITAETEVPTGGEILRDGDGDPAGVLLNRAGQLLLDATPKPDLTQTMANVHAGLMAMAEAGYVAVHEAGADGMLMYALETLERSGQLPIRVYAMLSSQEEALLQAWLEKGPDADTESMLRTRSVKAYYDGALGSRGAWLLEDYADGPGQRGVAGTGYGFNEGIVAEMMRAGFQVSIHAIGDAGNRETLAFIERVVAGDPDVRENRNRIEHAQVVHPDDFQRFAELDVIASMQPPHAVEDMSWAEQRLGPRRLQGAYAWRTMRRHGVRLIFGSDLPGSDHDIFYGWHAAITRRNKALEPAGGWRPEETLTPEEAVRAYTSWAAYAAFLEHETGAIEEGRLADLTVMDVDPFVTGETEPGRLLDGSIVMTVVGGQIVYENRE